MLPKVRTPGDVEMTDKLLTQIELASGFELGRIGIEAQIEDATGLIACEAIAAASPRMETLIFGPGDYSAAVGIPITTIGAAPDGYPGDHLNYVYSRLVVAARAAGHPGDRRALRARQATRRACARARNSRARSGLDGKWTIHPGQIAIVNEVFSPAREQWERAEAMLAAYERGPPRRGRRGDVRGRDDRRGQPQDGRADRPRGPRGRVRAMSSGARLAFLGDRGRDPRRRVHRAAAELRRPRDDRRRAHGDADGARRPPRRRRRDRDADADRERRRPSPRSTPARC